MSNRENFVAYEYKNVNVKRNSMEQYIDCMENFGWTLVDGEGYSAQALRSSLNPVNLGINIANVAQNHGEHVEDSVPVMLQFKRDRRIENKQQLDKLEIEYVEALSAIDRIERKNSAHTMGVSLGTGIVGAVFVGLSVYNFVAANIVLGVVFAVIGAIGWTIGFFSNRKVGSKKSTQAEPHVQAQLDIVYSACEKAHALLA